MNFDIPYDDKNIIIEYKLNEERRKNNKSLNLPCGVKQKNKTDIIWELKKNDIFNHSIDFGKFGWVQKVSVIWGIPPQKVNKWMKRYHKEFYETSCFKRKV